MAMLPEELTGAWTNNSPCADAKGIKDADDLSFLSESQSPGEMGRLGPYAVFRVLGRGGMGLVFEAFDPALDRRVALKVMRPEIAKIGSIRLRFIDEAKAAAKVEHDHVVPIFHVGDDRGVPYLAMPFLKGESLEQRLKRKPILSVAEAIRIGKEAAEGLAAAHNQGLIHRDIKPGNIWLEERPGHSPRVRILDFGLACSQNADSHVANFGTIVGTPAYMAPEQARGQIIDARADLFSLGVMLYQVTTGSRPFPGGDALAVLTSLAVDNPVPPQQLNPDIPQEFSDGIMALLEKDPRKRMGSAQLVIAWLQKISDRSVPTAPPEALNPRARTNDSAIGEPSMPSLSAAEDAQLQERGRRRLAARIAGVLTLVVAIVAGAVYVATHPSSEEAARDRSNEKTATLREVVKVETAEKAKEREKTAGGLVAPNKEIAQSDMERKAADMLHPYFEMNCRLLNPESKVLFLCKPTEPLPNEPYAVVGLNGIAGNHHIPTELFMSAMANLKSLVHIKAFSTELDLTDAELSRMSTMPFASTLEGLMVRNFELTQNSIAALKKFPNLTTAWFKLTTIDDAALAKLVEGLPRLVSLDLNGLGKSGRVTARGVAQLTKLPLREIFLRL